VRQNTVAEVCVDTLALAGVTTVYGVAGDSLNGVTETIRRRGDIRRMAMLMGDLLWLRQLGLPVKLVVSKNNAFGFVGLGWFITGASRGVGADGQW
jgi:thiamine pyrophosphate-dependent acetolactate synthase large subunit-like protein